MTRPRFKIALGALLVIALLAAGCGSSSAGRIVLACRHGDPHPGPASAQLPPPFRAYSQAGTPTQRLTLAIDGGYGEWSRCEIRERAALGAPVTRHEWLLEEPVDAQDQLVLEAATEVHTRFHALLGGDELVDPHSYRDYVVAFIRRYGLGGSFWRAHPGIDEARYAITTFELGNEPYLGGMSADEYAAAIRPTLETVKRLRLPARLILVSGMDSDEDPTWIDTLYEAIPPLNSLAYGFAIHPYSFGEPPAGDQEGSTYRQIEDLRRAMDSLGAGGKPIFITEYGESTAACGEQCTGEATQARFLRQVIAGAVSHPAWDVEMISVFQLIDRGTETDERELGFGIMRQNGAHKPSYPVVSEAIQRYRGD